MGDIITYSLKPMDKTSDRYYKVVETFTDEVIEKINRVTKVSVKDFQAFILKSEKEVLRSKEEYAFEILVLGVLWKIYTDKALTLKEVPKAFLTKLTTLREKNSVLKKVVDLIKGFSGELWLLKEKNNIENIDKTIGNMEKLLDWLMATGEFKQEVKRLKQWKEYLANKPIEDAPKVISIAVDLADWFERRSKANLGYFTENVDEFLKEDYRKHKWKEDNVYCGRKRIEYHLNMVGAEIMNRAFRDDFLKTEEKRLLLPVCMRLHSTRDCKAVRSKAGYICAGCSEKCKVNHLAKIVRDYGVKVLIIPHESAAFTKEKIEGNRIGIIGVACVLNLISGGWKAKDFGFVPQCVLLDYCGCKNHWNGEGLVTEINLSKLKDILQISNK